MESHQYRLNLEWKAGRIGILGSPEIDERTFDRQQLLVATPPPFKHGEEGIWSPEHLYVAAAASCLMTTFLAIAENSRLEFESFTCEATGTLGQADGKMVMTTLQLKPVVEINDPKAEARTLRILEKSEKACLITNSMTAEVQLEPTVVVTNPVS